MTLISKTLSVHLRHHLAKYTYARAHNNAYHSPPVPIITTRATNMGRRV